MNPLRFLINLFRDLLARPVEFIHTQDGNRIKRGRLLGFTTIDTEYTFTPASKDKPPTYLVKKVDHMAFVKCKNTIVVIPANMVKML